MPRTIKIFAFSSFILAVMLIFAGCGEDYAVLDISSDTYLYTPDLDFFDMLITDDTQTGASESAEITELPETMNLPEAADDETADCVYWVSSGDVWHITEKCSTLSRSKNIKSGSVSDAMAAGKDRVCQRCGG